MIRRPYDRGHWLLISQTEHARLAGRCVWHWRFTGPWAALRSVLAEAVTHHDDGWAAWEARPQPDPVSGDPLNFTEMPLEVSTALWEVSVEAAGRAAERDVVASATQASDAGRTSAPDGSSGVCPPPCGNARVAQLGPSAARALGRIWVSRHFCWLAEQARVHRTDPRDRAAAERFLRKQAVVQDRCVAVLRKSVRDERLLHRLCEGGYRWVQFFDRISLWLCMDVAEERAATFAAPDGVSFQVWRCPDETVLVPSVIERRVVWRPFPFDVPSVRCEAAGKVIARRRYDADRLAAALGVAECLTLRWVMTPGTG